MKSPFKKLSRTLTMGKHLNKWEPSENETIQCKRCGEEKVYTLFARRGAQKPFECKTCRNNLDRMKRSLNRDEYNRLSRERYQASKDNINETRRKNLQERRNTDPRYRAMMALHCRLYMAVKKKAGKTMDLTGCSKEELCTHLESLFGEGMTWENYGKWHIDHIRPCSSFNLENPEEQRICFHWKNLQPLWAEDNIKKSDTWNV